MEIFKVVFAAVFSAAALFVIAKIIGHKQVAQLEFFDYIAGITIGSIAAEIATTLEDPWWKPIISLFVFGTITVILSLLTRKFPKTRKYINGTPTIIMDGGKFYRKNMKKAKLELSEFMLLCRQEGYFNLDDIQTAVFEYNGKLSILPVSTKRPLNAEDMSLSPQQEYISAEVIMDGKALDENLQRLGFNENWLVKQIKQQGYSEIEDVFLGIYNANGELILYDGE